MALALSLGRFYGIDSLVEFLTLVVSLIISLYSYKVYKLIKDKNYKLFSMGFLFIGISFIFKILSNITIFNKVRIEQANFIFTFFSRLEYMQLINFFSFILYKTFHIIGFLLLFLLLTKEDQRKKGPLFFYLSLIVVLFSVYFNFIFHMTVVFILIYLTLHFYENSKKRMNINALLVFISFLIILTGHLFFIFSDIHVYFYLIGEVLMLAGFLLLLINQVKLKKGHSNSKKSSKLYHSKKNK